MGWVSAHPFLFSRLFDMEKLYKSNTNLSINIVLASKANMHVSFTPQSDGTSLYRTANEDIQRGLERHYKYGKMFKLIETYDPDAEPEEENADENTASEESEGGLTQIEVTDWDSAKDWLAENTDVSRSQLRSQKAIIATADANGYEFVLKD